VIISDEEHRPLRSQNQWRQPYSLVKTLAVGIRSWHNWFISSTRTKTHLTFMSPLEPQPAFSRRVYKRRSLRENRDHRLLQLRRYRSYSLPHTVSCAGLHFSIDGIVTRLRDEAPVYRSSIPCERSSCVFSKVSRTILEPTPPPFYRAGIAQSV